MIPRFDVGLAPADLARIALFELRGHAISVLPANAFVLLPRLQYLLIRINGIATVEAGAFNGLSELWSLTLRENPVTSLPPNIFANLPKLYELNLGANRLRTLDLDDLMGHPVLSHISLDAKPDGDGLTAISAGFLHSLPPNLQFLDVSFNRQLRSAFQSLNITLPSTLRRLDLDGMAFSAWPSFLRRPNKLTSIEISFSTMDSLSVADFATLQSLESL